MNGWFSICSSRKQSTIVNHKSHNPVEKAVTKHTLHRDIWTLQWFRLRLIKASCGCEQKLSWSVVIWLRRTGIFFSVAFQDDRAPGKFEGVAGGLRNSLTVGVTTSHCGHSERDSRTMEQEVEIRISNPSITRNGLHLEINRIVYDHLSHSACTDHVMNRNSANSSTSPWILCFHLSDDSQKARYTMKKFMAWVKVILPRLNCRYILDLAHISIFIQGWCCSIILFFCDLK
jgi:hypothetical protein